MMDRPFYFALFNTFTSACVSNNPSDNTETLASSFSIF